MKDTKDLIKFLNSSGIEWSCSKEELASRSHDASVFEVLPAMVIFPKNEDEISRVMAFAHKYNSNIINSLFGKKMFFSVQAGLSCMTGGSLTSGVVFDLKKYMNSVGEVSVLEDRAVVDVQGGAWYIDIDAKISPAGYTFGGYPSSRDFCGIGGMIGNNSSGEKSLRFGATIDNVESVRVVLPDGSVKIFAEVPVNDLDKIENILEKRIYLLYEKYINQFLERSGSVPKAASGYRLDKVVYTNQSGVKVINLSKIFVGSQGTLGVVTSARLKLAPQPIYSQLVLVSVQSLLQLPVMLNAALSKNPEGVETFDAHTFEKIKQSNKNTAKFTEEELAFVDGFFSRGQQLLLLVQFSESSDSETKKRATDFYEEMLALGSDKDLKLVASVINDKLLEDALWSMRRMSYTAVRDNCKPGFKAVPCIEDVIVPTETLDVFLPQIRALMDEEGLEYGFHGHVGEGSLRIIPVLDFRQGPPVDSITRLMKNTFSIVERLGGNMSADHSDGIIRTPFLRTFYGEDVYVNVFAWIKHFFDPQNKMNPGKKIKSNSKDPFSDIKKYILK